MAQVNLTLTDNSGGSITFEGVELPQALNWGSQQHIAAHDFVGGGRQVQALGGQPDPLTWSGIFFGLNAADRAKYLDTQAIEGNPVVLTWDTFSYVCVVRSFQASYLAPWHVRYSITLEAAVNANGSQPTAPRESLLTLINQGVQQSSCLGSLIGDSTLTTLLGNISAAAQTLNSAVESATAPIAMASACIQQATQTAQSALTAMLAPISLAQARVSALITGVDNAANLIDSVTGAAYAGATPQAIESLASANISYGVAQPLYSLQGTLGVMAKNINAGTPGASAKLIAVNGANLQAIAAQQYNDATLWPAIAQINGLSDPNVPAGARTLQIPDAAVARGGL